MNKKNLIRVVLATCLTLGISVTTVFASSIKDQSEKRLYGLDRFATAVAISQQGWTSSDSVVLADAYDFPDALIGGPLAYEKNAPILLTDKDSLNDTTLAEIKRLNAKDVYIIGDVSQNVEDNLISSGYNVQRISGDDKFKTAVNVGQAIINEKQTDTVFLSFAYNFPDALSASTFAAQKGYPILFTGTDTLNEDTKNAIKNWNIKNVYVLGGTGVISSDVETTLKSMGVNTIRLSGESRYDTGMQIIKQFDNNTYNGLTIASGLNFPDALAGSVLAAKENAPIMIFNAGNITSTAADFIRSKSKNIYVLGGEGSIPENDITSLLSQTNTKVVNNNSNNMKWTFVDSFSFAYPYLGQEYQLGPDKAIYIAIHTNSERIQDYTEIRRVADDKVLKRTYTNGETEEFNPAPVSSDDVAKFNDKYDPVKVQERLEQKAAEQNAEIAKEEADLRSQTVKVVDTANLKITIFPLSDQCESYLHRLGDGKLGYSTFKEAPLPADIQDKIGDLQSMVSGKEYLTPIEIAIVPYADSDYPNGCLGQEYGNYTFMLFNNGTSYESQLQALLSEYQSIVK